MKIAKESGSGAANNVVPLQYLPLERLALSSKIPNRDLDPKWLEELYASVKANGLDTPLTVWDGNGAKMKLGNEEVPASFVIAGFHRRNILKKLAKDEPAVFKKHFPNGIPVILRSGSLEDALFAQLRENVDRKNMEFSEIFPFLKRLKTEFKLEQNEIARRVGKSKAWVSQVFDIENTLGEDATQEISKGKLGLKDAIKVKDAVKKKKAAGEAVDAKAEVQNKVSEKEAKGNTRVKKVSVEKLWGRIKTLPSMTVGKRLEIYEAAFRYLVGERSSLPPELKAEVEAAKPKAKAKKAA